MSEIVYLKAEVIERQEGTVLVRVLNGYGEPEIRAVEESTVEDTLLGQAHRAIVDAVMSEEGLDGRAAENILDDLEHISPAAKANADALNAGPAR